MSAFESLYGDQCTLHVSTKGAYNNYLSELVCHPARSVNQLIESHYFFKLAILIGQFVDYMHYSDGLVGTDLQRATFC